MPPCPRIAAVAERRFHLAARMTFTGPLEDACADAEAPVRERAQVHPRHDEVSAQERGIDRGGAHQLRHDLEVLGLDQRHLPLAAAAEPGAIPGQTSLRDHHGLARGRHRLAARGADSDPLEPPDLGHVLVQLASAPAFHAGKREKRRPLRPGVLACAAEAWNSRRAMATGFLRSSNLAPLFVLASLLFAAPAAAQTVRLDQYRMAETPEDGFAISRPDDLGHLRFGARLDLDYALNPLVYQLRGSDPGSEVSPVVEHLLDMQVGLSLGLFERLVIYLGMPFNLVMDGDLVDGQPRADGTSIGDFYLGVRGRLFGEDDDAFALSLQVTATAPTAEAARFQSRFAGEGNFTIEPEVLFEIRIASVVRITGDIGARVRERQDFGSLEVSSELTWGLGFYIDPVPDKVFTIALETFGSSAFDRFGQTQVTPWEALLGLQFQPVPGLHLGIAGGTGIVRGWGSPDFRGIVSVGYATPDQAVGDRDDDGIADDRDQCPDEPEDIDQHADDDGCPDPDNDGDGINDLEDQCRDQAEDADGLEDQDGCPEDDADGDGVTDENDRCPTEPGVALAPRPDCTGCPTCSDDPPPQVDETAPEIADRVYFDTGRHVLRPSEERALASVEVYLNEHPNAQIVVEGHADFRGTEPDNEELSRNRARRVIGWLVQRGADRARLVGSGCGELHPIESNDTRDGRQANRRVEFRPGSGHRSGCTPAN
jgi:outer membrane protein OmpA-like peptidoglycan-associated protein